MFVHAVTVSLGSIWVVLGRHLPSSQRCAQGMSNECPWHAEYWWSVCHGLSSTRAPRVCAEEAEGGNQDDLGGDVLGSSNHCLDRLMWIRAEVVGQSTQTVSSITLLCWADSNSSRGVPACRIVASDGFANRRASLSAKTGRASQFSVASAISTQHESDA